jgi:putative endonuclease
MLDFSDVGSTPTASTILRQGFGWQANFSCRLKPCFFAKDARRSFNEGGMPAEVITKEGPSLEQQMPIKFVYLLQSLLYPAQRYVGMTSDVEKRLAAHNAGQSTHTAKYRPWKLATYLAFSDEKQAADFEKYLKSGSGRAFANKRLWPEQQLFMIDKAKRAFSFTSSKSAAKRGRPRPTPERYRSVQCPER